MTADPPFAGRDEHAIQYRFAAVCAAVGPAHFGGVIGKHRRLRTRGENYSVDFERFQREVRVRRKQLRHFWLKRFQHFLDRQDLLLERGGVHGKII